MLFHIHYLKKKKHTHFVSHYWLQINYSYSFCFWTNRAFKYNFCAPINYVMAVYTTKRDNIILYYKTEFTLLCTQTVIKLFKFLLDLKIVLRFILENSRLIQYKKHWMGWLNKEFELNNPTKTWKQYKQIILWQVKLLCITNGKSDLKVCVKSWRKDKTLRGIWYNKLICIKCTRVKREEWFNSGCFVHTRYLTNQNYFPCFFNKRWWIWFFGMVCKRSTFKYQAEKTAIRLFSFWN